MRRRLPARPLLGLLLVTGVPAEAAQLVVRVENVDVGRGNVRFAVCARSFDEAGCDQGATTLASAATLEQHFDLPPGRYAVAVYQDVDSDGKMDTIPPGLPTEPYAFSNDVGRFAPPAFERALVQVGAPAGPPTVLTLRLRRLLGL